MCGLLDVNFTKQDDPASRLDALLSQFDDSFRTEFLTLINGIRNSLNIEDIIDLIEAGQIQQAINTIQSNITRFSDIVVSAVIASGQDTAKVLSDILNVVVSFDQTNFRAVDELRNSRLNLITALTNTQRDAIREALVEGTRRGLNPRQQAINFRQAIGLTQRQVQQVNSFRRLLEEGNPQALNRTLRDRRFDPTIRRAIEGESLTAAQVDRIVQRYADRQLIYRSQVIARTESLRAVHQGNEMMYQQAVAEGALDPTRLVKEWITSGDSRVRDSHDGMNGQIRGFNEPFVSDFGNFLRYPGDGSAPASETIQCRCLVTTRLSPIEELI